jgi:hypothetical protein
MMQPFPVRLSAANQGTDDVAPMNDPVNDPFGDRRHSVLQRGTAASYRPPRAPQTGNPIGLNSPGSIQADDANAKQGGRAKEDLDQIGRDELPPKRNTDRRFETNCEDVAAEVASRSISYISLNLRPSIKDDDQIPYECPMTHIGSVTRCWNAQTFTFTASALCHKPLYFEDVQLERYGHSAGPYLQPFKSTAHFFIRAALLPYQIGIHPPNECRYALGYYRPGDCAPWLMDPFPISERGLLYQAGFAVGAAYVVP